MAMWEAESEVEGHLQLLSEFSASLGNLVSLCFKIKRGWGDGSEMKMFASSLYDLISIPRTHMMERLDFSSCDLHMCTMELVPAQ